MTYPAITIAAFALISTHTDHPTEIAEILNKNLPLVGGGTTRSFTLQEVHRILTFFLENQPDYYYAIGFDDDPNIGQTRDFLVNGGLARIAELPGINPNQTLSYDSLMVTTDAIIRAAGAETRPLPRRGSFVRTRETVGGAGDGMQGWGDGMRDWADEGGYAGGGYAGGGYPGGGYPGGGYDYGGYAGGGYGQGGYGQDDYPRRRGGRRRPRSPRDRDPYEHFTGYTGW